jgi:hypothetical protein
MCVTNKNLGDRATSGFLDHLLLELWLKVNADFLDVCHAALAQEGLGARAEWAEG